MFNKTLNFIKYNNFTVLILAIIFIVGTGALAATDTGQAVIGEKQTSTRGIDNTLLLEADLDALDMDFKIERVEEDIDYYYVVYTYLDLVKIGRNTPPLTPPPGETNEEGAHGVAWEYQLEERTRKVSKSLKQDLGEYLTEELLEQYEARIKELGREQAKARETGSSVREEVSAYSGLIGRTLNLAGKVFPSYKPVKMRVIPSPSTPPTVLVAREIVTTEGVADDLTDVYNDYIAEKDPDSDDVFGTLDNCPNDFNPDQLDADNDGIGDECDEFFTLAPVEEDATSTEETGNISTTTPVEDLEPIATTTPEEEAEVVIVELDEEKEAATSTN